MTYAQRDRTPQALAAATVLALVVLAGCSAEEEPPVSTPTVVVTPTETAEAVPDLVDESCGEIARATAGFPAAMQEALADITTAPEAFSQVAANLRAAAADAGSEVAAAAGELADAVDQAAERARQGDFFGVDFDAFQPALDRLATACGS